MCYEKGVNLFGARHPEDYYVCQVEKLYQVEDWARSPDPATMEAHWCAMCCVRSIQLATGHRWTESLEKLFQIACRWNVYRPAEIGWKGAYHYELGRFAMEACSRVAYSARAQTTEEIQECLYRGYFCLLSVHPDIRLRSTEVPAIKRGHFVLIYGYKIDEKNELHFLVNNSAGFVSQESQIGMRVSAQRIKDVSSGDAVFIHSTSYYYPHC